MWNHILYTTDFSETAENAFSHALTLSVLNHARLTLLHVRVPLQDDPNNPDFHFPGIEEIHDRAAEVASKFLREKSREAAGIQVDTRVMRGIDADSAILSCSSEIESDMILMGTHGRRGIDHFILGSVTRAVIQKSPVPVFTVRNDVVAPDPELPYRRVLVPVDLSDRSAEALKTASEFVDGGTEVTVLHVRQGLTEENSRATMKHLLEPFAEYSFSSVITEGIPEETILREVRTRSIDLIIMPRKGQSLLEYVLLGSTTERIIRTAPCPVVSVPA